MIALVHVYALAGLLFAVLAYLSLKDSEHPRRWTTAAFWALLALAFLAGERMPAWSMGLAVLGLATLAGFGGVKAGRLKSREAAAREASARRFGHRLFLPALCLPGFTVLASLGLPRILIAGQPLVDPAQGSLIGLGLGSALAFAYALRMTGEALRPALDEARHTLDSIAWAALLPLLLAMLGSVFSKAGVGTTVAQLITENLALDQRLPAVLAYALGMALFTVIMGNAFAAFPVMTAGIGLPILVQRLGADPGPVAAIGMLSGYCGTLLTPMAANFNIVPVALLELSDKHAVIRAQVATALPLLACNVLLMYWLAF
ncbi:MAG: DUF979 domain-containing protein [Gammaproteobacteria bacterium]|nr:DUF979 domain-containing protein [Gammaproteobacteria bacterium]